MQFTNIRNICLKQNSNAKLIFEMVKLGLNFTSIVINQQEAIDHCISDIQALYTPSPKMCCFLTMEL